MSPSKEHVARGVEAAWCELETQRLRGVYVDRGFGAVDGDVDMEAIVRAILSAVQEDLE